MKFFVVVAFVAGWCAVEAVLPSYIKPCSRKNNFDACALESAKYAIPLIAEGDPDLKIPSMKPLLIPKVDLDAGGFKLKMTDLKIHGLERTEPISMKTDFEKRQVTMTSKVDRIDILGDYEINGKIQILPIEGKGPCNITLLDGEYTFTFSWDLETRDGKEYAKLLDDKSIFEYKLRRVTYRFENLFNGDKRLGEEMNKFLNENWEEVDKDLKKPFGETLLKFYNDLSSKFYSQVPYNEMFLD